MSKILDIVNAPWAIEPEKLREIQAIYATHLRGEKIDIAAVEARLGQPLNNEQKNYEVIDGVAVLPLFGVIAKRMNLFSKISGGVSTEVAARDLQQALDDPQVKSIILHIDSPGGTVDGTQTLSDLVYQARGEKKIVTLADGRMASGGYWIGSAASEVFISEETAVVGSIGVVTSHIDVSKAEEKLGRKTTEIYAGKFKRIDSSYKPLSKDGKEYLQEQVDYLYSIFVGAVARNRGVDIETVLTDMADGRVFIGQQAIEAGLADGVSTLPELIAQLNEGQAAGDAFLVASNHNEGIGEITMDITMETVLSDAPEVAEALRAEGRAAGVEEGAAAGATAERERIQAVQEQSLQGHEALIEQLKFDGKTTGEEAAVAVNAAERELRQKNGTDLAADAAAASAPFAAAPDKEDEATADASKPLEEQAKAAWDADINLQAEFSGNFTTYLSYCQGIGKVEK